jgi:hypothetical protein
MEDVLDETQVHAVRVFCSGFCASAEVFVLLVKVQNSSGSCSDVPHRFVPPESHKKTSSRRTGGSVSLFRSFRSLFARNPFFHLNFLTYAGSEEEPDYSSLFRSSLMLYGNNSVEGIACSGNNSVKAYVKSVEVKELNLCVPIISSAYSTTSHP